MQLRRQVHPGSMHPAGPRRPHWDRAKSSRNSVGQEIATRRGRTDALGLKRAQQLWQAWAAVRRDVRHRENCTTIDGLSARAVVANVVTPLQIVTREPAQLRTPCYF